jgi:hypothetical protein
MLEWLWNADDGLWLGAIGLVTAIVSLIYARSQARGAKAQVEAARSQAVEALVAAQLLAKGARETAAEALRAAQLVAKGARETAAEALRAAGLVAENARQQAVQALRAAELLANSAVSARVREMRSRNFQSNPDLPAPIKALIKEVGGPVVYGVMLDSVDIAQEIYVLRKRRMVSDDHWQMWMDDHMVLIARSPGFQKVFRRAASKRALQQDFVEAFETAFQGHPIEDPGLALAATSIAAPSLGANGTQGPTLVAHGPIVARTPSSRT